MNSTELSVFNYESQPIRTVSVDGEPWFVLKDVCDVLGISHVTNTARRLEEDEVAQTDLIDSKGRNQRAYIVNEPGLYNVILRSDKPEAKAFKRWVTHEVLPVLRRTGSYQVAPLSTAEQLLQSAQLMVEHERRMKELEAKQQDTTRQIGELANVYAVPSCADRDEWSEEMNRRISSICLTYGLTQQSFRGELYRRLEEQLGINLETRQKNLRRRMERGGAKYAERMAVTKLQVISQDAKLRPAFEMIVRNEAARRFCSQSA